MTPTDEQLAELRELLEQIALKAMYVEVWRKGEPANSKLQVMFCKHGSEGLKEKADRALAIVKGEVDEAVSS